VQEHTALLVSQWSSVRTSLRGDAQERAPLRRRSNLVEEHSMIDGPEEIAASGLPTGTRFAFPGRWADACEGCRPRPFGIIGGETFDPGYAGDPVRTSWRKLPPPPVSP